MKIKFNITEGQICRVVTLNGIACATYYEENQEYDLNIFISTIESAKKFMERYDNNIDVYL